MTMAPDKLWWVAACAVLLLAAGRYLASADEPWDDSIESYNNGFYIGQIVRNFDRVGWRELRGQPVLSYVPGQDESLVRAYLHHPPFYSWMLHGLTQICGRSERVLRLPSILATLLTALLIWVFCQRRYGEAAAFFALLGFLGNPFILRYGDMVNYEAICALLILAAALATQSSAANARWRVALLVFLATSIDWQGAFAVASVAVLHLGVPWRRFWRALVIPISAAVLSVVFSLICFAVWRYGEGSASGETYRLASSSIFGLETPLQWWLNQSKFLALQIGAPLVVLSLIALGLHRPNPKATLVWRLVLALVIPGVINVCLFRRHSFEHPYWWQASVAGFAVGAAIGWQGIMQWRPRIGVFVAGITILSMVWLAFQDGQQSHRSLLPRAAAANALFDNEDLMIRPDGFGPEAYYYDFWSYDEARDPVMLATLFEAYRMGRVSVGKIVYVLPLKVALERPDLKKALDAMVTPRRVDSFFVYEW